jgi:hypothetical protein
VALSTPPGLSTRTHTSFVQVPPAAGHDESQPLGATVPLSWGCGPESPKWPTLPSSPPLLAPLEEPPSVEAKVVPPLPPLPHAETTTTRATTRRARLDQLRRGNIAADASSEHRGAVPDPRPKHVSGRLVAPSRGGLLGRRSKRHSARVMKMLNGSST